MFWALVVALWNAILDVWWLWVANAGLLLLHVYRRRFARYR